MDCRGKKRPSEGREEEGLHGLHEFCESEGEYDVQCRPSDFNDRLPDIPSHRVSKERDVITNCVCQSSI